MAFIEVTNLRKSFGLATAVHDISFSVDAGDILVIVGASGCGKTTTLRCIAGLEEATAGTIKIAGQTMVEDGFSLPPERRGIGMMFQSYALWPHKTIYENVAYGLTIKAVPKDKVREAVTNVLELVGLSGMEGRYPATLSGGQQQRVALARSAVAEPKVLLLDEPLSNLDAKLREQMRIDLRRMIKSLNMTAIHITHDQTEAMAIADQVIYMRNGVIEQKAAPRDLYRHPATRHVAAFVGNAMFLDGKLTGSDDAGHVRVKLADSVELLAAPAADRPASDNVTLSIRSESVELFAENPGGPNSFQGEITQDTFLGDHTQYMVDVGGAQIPARDRRDLPVGSRVFLRVAPEDIVCFAREKV
jgi:ABC-type Fe3+/spermidine/putrescine transport system ATPase subunit